MIQTLKQLFRSLLPHRGNRWLGNYPNWQSASQASGGYDAPEILEKIKNAALKVKSGEYACERDSVLFEEKQYDWALVAFLLKAAYENQGNLTVLDFGGSLGSSYFTVRDIIAPLKSLKWCIVEQENFVACGKAYFEDENLLFYNTIESCLAEHQPQVFLLSSVLQYLESPLDLIPQVNAIRSLDYLILLRTSVSDQDEDRICIQQVDPSIYKASYPSWIFSEQKLLNQFDNWQLAAKGISPLHTPEYISGFKFYWKDFIFQNPLAHPDR